MATRAVQRSRARRTTGWCDSFSSSTGRLGPLPLTSTPSVTQDSRNAFERLLLLSHQQIHHLELRACLANARERQPDEGGNIWHEHIRPRDGSAWVFRVDHETGDIFGDIYPDEVFGVLYPSEMLDEEYADSSGDPDSRKVRALYRSKVPQLSRRDETQAADTIHYLWDRSDWLVSLLYGEQPPADLSLPDDDLQHELSLPAFRDAPGLALYWLWRAFFLDDGPALAQVLPEAKQSHLAVIRDAARLVEQLQNGKIRVLGPVKDALAVRTAFLAARSPGASKLGKPSRRR